MDHYDLRAAPIGGDYTGRRRHRDKIYSHHAARRDHTAHEQNRDGHHKTRNRTPIHKQAILITTGLDSTLRYFSFAGIPIQINTWSVILKSLHSASLFDF